MTVGERIKEVRINRNISQVDLAAKIGVSKQTLYKYENNIITNIPSDKIEAIANICKLPPAYFMGWENNTINITKNLRHIMSLKKITAEELSRKSGISDTDIQVILDGVPAPVPFAHILADALDVLVKYLVDYDINKIDVKLLEDQLSSKILTQISFLLFDLNPDGLREAYKRVEELTFIPKYITAKRNDTIIYGSFDSLDSCNAAHERTDIEIPKGTNTSENNIMDDENF